MASKDEDQSKWARLYADLDRLMQSADPREARDVVAGDPLLLGPAVADWLDESAKRARQLGEMHMAESIEHWQRVLRTFREFGVQEGYLELVINQLIGSQTPERDRQIVRDNPELADEATDRFIARRIEESAAVGDEVAVAKYTMAGTIIHAGEISGPEPEEADTITEAVNAFLYGFVEEPDPIAQRQFLEAHPDLLQPPLTFIVASMFMQPIERARATNDLVTLRALLLRQALFIRCQEVGVARAFQELAEGVLWDELDRR